jgi:hypothetical protein
MLSIVGRTKSGACAQNGKPVAWQQTYRGNSRIKR